MLPAPSHLLESSLYVDCLQQARDFYGGVLRLTEHSYQPERHVFYRLAQQMLLLFVAEATGAPPQPGERPIPPHGATGAGHVAFVVAPEMLDQWRTRLTASGVAIESEIEWAAGVRSLYFRDPAGNSLEFAPTRLWF